MRQIRRGPALAGAAAIALPVALTALLVTASSATSRDYVFLYLGIVAMLGLGVGLWPALIAGATSFLCVDFYFIPPLHTLTIASGTDLVTLLVFAVTACVVGGFGSLRRRAHLRAGALTRELRTANDELERLGRQQAEAARTAVRLAQTQQQVLVLEEADRVRRELLQNVSHELRTPLATILTGVTALAARPGVPDTLRAELGALAGEARRLDRLVGDLLDMARIQGGALDLQISEVDMRDALDAAVQRLHRASPERPVETEVDGDAAEVVADWDRVGQVLDNLLANADRHSPAGSPLSVRVVAGARGMTVTHVVDRGPGVPAEMEARVFDRFVTDGHGGVGIGLGLAIVRGLVEAQGGRVWLEHGEPGGGAHFAFTLPTAEPSPGDGPVTSTASLEANSS